jgi:hypothetical protein
MEPETFIATDSAGAIEWSFSGTQRTELPGYPGIGTQVCVRGVTTLVVGDGKFSRVRDYCELSAGTGLRED